MTTITKENFAFLKNLANNNNRDWFTENKPEFLKQQLNTTTFGDELISLLNEHDLIETPTGKKSLYRIYRDIRFSKDKTPYKSYWGMHFKRATKQLRGGYYLHIESGNKSFVGGGFWSPNKDDLQRVREEINLDASEIREIINSKSFIETFGTLDGEQLKTAPRGFDKEHPDVDLLRYKQFLFGKNFSDTEVLDKNFMKNVNTTFIAMRPFFDYMSSVLTTDLNGESII